MCQIKTYFAPWKEYWRENTSMTPLERKSKRNSSLGYTIERLFKNFAAKIWEFHSSENPSPFITSEFVSLSFGLEVKIEWTFFGFFKIDTIWGFRIIFCWQNQGALREVQNVVSENRADESDDFFRDKKICTSVNE